GSGGSYGGSGGAGLYADGGGGAGLGGAVFVRDGGTLVIQNGSFTGAFGVTAGVGGDNGGGATDGTALGNVMFLHGTASTTFLVDAGNTVTIGDGSNAGAGSIAGTAGLTKSGVGTLILAGSNSYTGATTVVGGTLRIDGATTSSAIDVNAGATLGGNGAAGGVAIGAGGTLAPGASAGILSITSLAFSAGASFAVEIGGADPGTGGYDQALVDGAVDLGGASLDATLIEGFTPSFGDSFIIVSNSGSDPVSGTFAGLAEGAIVSVGGTKMIISYQGGDGNDVVLQAGVVITGTSGADRVDASHTVAGQPLPTAVGDLIKGKGGADTLSGLAGDDQIRGNGGADTLNGNQGDDSLRGGKGMDRLKGGKGDDWIDGQKKSDTLTGGGGDDCFAFTTKLGTNNVDQITDFGRGHDLIYLDDAIFKGLGEPGALDSKHFTTGIKADGGKSQIIYSKIAGAIWYAKDGDEGGRVLFAKVDGGTDLHADDFMMF
ncbi:MAG: autotransporter-associated beta strand repeat-containing protein, partial [Bauldia litoralis]